MIIEQIRADNFGKLKKKEITLQPGINLIYGQNESGKSTLFTFIKCMWFGLRRMRGRASRTDLYSRYLPWEHPDTYGGSMRFTCANKHFRLERNFSKAYPREELICEEDGESLSVEHGDLQMLLGGISEAAYENTVSVGQQKSETDEYLAAEIRNYIANYEDSGDGSLDLEQVLETLKAKKRALESDRKERCRHQEERQRELEIHLDHLEKERERLRQSAEATERNLQRMELENEDDIREDVHIDEAQRESSEKQYGWIVFGLLVLIYISSIYVFPKPVQIAGGVLSIVCLIYLAAQIKKAAGKKLKTQNLKKEPSDQMQKKQNLQWKKEHLEEELAENEIQLENLKVQYEEELRQQAEDSEWEELEALSMAQTQMLNAARSMGNKLSGRLNVRTSEILRQLTHGRYEKLYLDEKLQMTVHTRERRVPLEQLSRGTLEQVYFALRMAAGEMLCEEEMPVILDDTFAMYDDSRLKECLQWLAEHRQQVLILTCQRREQEHLEELGIPYHLVTL